MGQARSDSSSGIGQGIFNLKAGTSISQNDVLELGPDGRCYPVVVTDYAAVANVTYGVPQTSVATGRITAQTQVVGARTLAYYRQAVLQGDEGETYTLTTNGDANGLLLSKYSSAGGLISQVAIDSSATPYFSHQAVFLSDGNIAIYAVNNSYVGKFAIYSKKMVAVKSLTSLSEAANDRYSCMVELSAGGFAVVYQANTNPLLSRLVTYDNAGTVVLAPTTIWTRTGSNATQLHRMVQLSSGNLAVAVSSSNTGSSVGLYHGIVTTGGVSVAAFVNLDTSSVGVIPEISVMTGFYAISRHSGAALLAFVFNNSGALQGSGFSGGNGNGAGSTLSKLLNDGVAFWLIWPNSNDGKEAVTKLPTSGVGHITTDVTTIPTQYNFAVDAFYENGLIVCASQTTASGNAAPTLWVISTETGQLINAAGTTFGSSPTTGSGQYQRILPGGDFSFICLYDYSISAATNLCVGKYANTAVMGVAQSSAVKDALVSCSGAASGYAANFLKGSTSKQFDHSATNIYGNKGALMNYGAVMKGF